MLFTLLTDNPLVVSPEEFRKVRPKVIVDVRDPEAYSRSHIPGAVNLPVDEFLTAVDNVPFHLLQFDTLVDRISALGVRQDDRVLIYSSARLPYHYLNVAALYMVLMYLGFKEVYVLNGGFEAWVSAGKEVSNRKGLIGRVRLKAKPDSSFIVTLEDLLDTAYVESVRVNDQYYFVDGRLPEYYFGILAPPFYTRMGHISGARSLPFTFFLRSVKKDSLIFYVLDDKSKIDSILKLNLHPSKINVFYGNTPREAAFFLMLLDYVGYPRERYRLYLNGFPEWSRDTTLPVVRYKWE